MEISAALIKPQRMPRPPSPEKLVKITFLLEEKELTKLDKEVAQTGADEYGRKITRTDLIKKIIRKYFETT